MNQIYFIEKHLINMESQKLTKKQKEIHERLLILFKEIIKVSEWDDSKKAFKEISIIRKNWGDKLNYLTLDILDNDLKRLANFKIIDRRIETPSNKTSGKKKGRLSFVRIKTSDLSFSEECSKTLFLREINNIYKSIN